MNKRVWSIAVALVMILSMICSAFVVSAADESISEGGVSDAAVQLNNSASGQPMLLDADSGSALTHLALSTRRSSLKVDEEFTVSVSLENYNGGWAIFVAELEYDDSVVTYKDYTAQSVQIPAATVGGEPTELQVTVEENDGMLRFYWMSEGGVNLPAAEGGASIKLLDLTFMANKVSETGAGLSLSLLDEGVAGYVEHFDPDLGYVVYGDPVLFSAANGDYSAEPSVLANPIRKISPYLTIELEKEVVKYGEDVTAFVTLNEYYEGWLMMSLDLQYDGQKFDYVGSESIENLVCIDPEKQEEIPVTMLVAETEDPQKPLSVCFISTTMGDMVLKNGEASAKILKLTLRAKSSGNDIEIGTSFKEGGNYQMDSNGNEVLLSGTDDYIEQHEDGKAQVDVEQSVFPYLSMEIVADEGNSAPPSGNGETVFTRGDKFTIKVGINDYLEPWAMMSLLVNLDFDVYEVDLNNIVAFGGNGVAVPMFSEKNPNNLGITILAEDGYDLYLEQGLSSGTVVEIPVTVREKSTASGSDFPITVSFLKGGNLFQNADAVYNETPFEQQIAVRGKPELSIRIDGEETGPLQEGEEVRFIVSVKDFAAAWEIMSLKVLFNSDAFELVSDSVEDLEAFDDSEGHSRLIAESSASAMLACWFNIDPMYMRSPNSDILAFTLKAKKHHLSEDELLQAVSVEFLEGANYSNGAVLNGDNYNETPAETTVTLEPATEEPEPEDLIEVEISWGAMEFTYRFGSWNTEYLRWDGAGWNCDPDANKITVTNKGEVDITAAFDFTSSTTGVSGAFYRADDVLIDSEMVVDKVTEEILSSMDAYLKLEQTGEPTQGALGTIKVTIDIKEDET